MKKQFVIVRVEKEKQRYLQYIANEPHWSESLMLSARFDVEDRAVDAILRLPAGEIGHTFQIVKLYQKVN
jgi:hypothetical protein